MTDVLVVGADGFVGTHLMQTLREREISAMGVDKPDQPSEWPEARTIISLAATADPRECLRDPVNAYVNSVRIMVQTLEHARKVGAGVLHVSTNEVYGVGNGPVGPYAGAKACQDLVCGTYRDVDVTTVVTQSLFGEHQQPDKFVPTVIRKLLANESIGLQRGDKAWASRPFMHVDNLVDGLLYLVDAGTSRRRVHIGAEETISVLLVMGVLASALGRAPLLRAVPAGDRPGHELIVDAIGCDVHGWRPQYELAPALRNMARYALSNPDPAHTASARKAA